MCVNEKKFRVELHFKLKVFHDLFSKKTPLCLCKSSQTSKVVAVILILYNSL